MRARSMIAVTWLAASLLATALEGCGSSRSAAGAAPVDASTLDVDEEGGPNSDPSGPAIYVSNAGSDQASGQTPSEAMRTINAAIARAAACPGGPCLVKVAGGEYAGQVTVADGVGVYGGYSIDFSQRDIAINAAILVASASPTVDASHLQTPTTLDGLTVKGADASALSDGSSSIALAVHDSGTALVVSNAIVVGGTAARGITGATGGTNTCNATGGTGGMATDCSSATGGSGNAGGDPENGGGGGGGGSSDCPSACPLVSNQGVSDGSPGAPGGDGAPGAGGHATPATAGTMESGGAWTGTTGGPGGSGTNGTGGGGGGSGGTKKIRACFGCGTLLGGQGANGAPGGCSGTGGGGGGSGGASIAVLVDASRPTFHAVTIVGGKGGAGGTGGHGGSGTTGGVTVDAGAGAANWTKCGLIDYGSGNGGLGGVGGKGGDGGGGAGGNGGPSIAIASLGTPGVAGSPMIQVGTGGAGGAGGAGPGGAGAAGNTGAAVAEQAF